MTNIRFQVPLFRPLSFSLKKMPSSCRFCGKPFKNETSVRKHQELAVSCRKELEGHLRSYGSRSRKETLRAQDTRDLHNDNHEATDGHEFHHQQEPGDGMLRSHTGTMDHGVGRGDGDHRRARVDEAEDEGDPPPPVQLRFVESFPDAGKPISDKKRRTDFEKMRDERMNVEGADGSNPLWDPFLDEEEWNLAEWLIKGVGQNKIDEFLKLPIVSSECNQKIQD